MTNDVKLNNAQVAAAPKKRKRRASLAEAWKMYMPSRIPMAVPK